MPHDFPRGRSPPVSRPSPSTQVLSGSKSHFAAGQLTSKFQKMAVAAPVKAAKVNTTVESECHLPVSSESWGQLMCPVTLEWDALRGARP